MSNISILISKANYVYNKSLNDIEKTRLYLNGDQFDIDSVVCHLKLIYRHLPAFEQLDAQFCKEFEGLSKTSIKRSAWYLSYKQFSDSHKDLTVCIRQLKDKYADIYFGL